MSVTRRALAGVAWLVLAAATADLMARPLARVGLLGASGGDGIETTLMVGVAAAILLLVLARGPRLRMFTAFALLFVAGLYTQQRVGARLQGDGFYYFAYLRSIAFDRDVNFINDYELIGLGDKPHLFNLTPTGHAQSAWTIGPAIIWAPFFGAAHLIALPLSQTRPNVPTNGTSYPYRQAVCIAGLFYGLVGVYFTMRLCALFAARRVAVAATALSIAGSFMIWYIVREPSMTHAPALASVAAFAWLWASTLWRRSTGQWIVLGAIGGLMAAIRWQSAIYGVLPLLEVAVLASRFVRAGDRAALVRLSGHAAAGGAAFVIGFLPQMLAWKAIYGSYLAVSPVGPAIRWTDPHWADVLWSSRNGLFSMSPILYLASLGLIVLVRRHRFVGVAFVLSLAVMVWFNSMIQDWWGSAAFGARRFDGAVPLLAVGLAMAIDTGRRLVAARPLIPAAVMLAGAVAWNATFASVLRRDAFQVDRQNDFGAVIGAQWQSVHDRFGHPFSFPANTLFAWRNDVSPGLYDLYLPHSFFNDPVTPHAQIDFGGARDALFLGEGFFPPAFDDAVTYRGTSRQAEIVLPIARLSRLRFQFRLRASTFPGAPPQRLTIRINEASFGPFELRGDWDTIAFDVEPALLKTTINRVWLVASRGGEPARDGSGDDSLEPAVMIDLLRIDRTDVQ